MSATPQHDQVVDRIRELLHGECGVAAEVEPGSLLQEDLGLDSLGALVLATGLEEHYRLRLDEHEGELPATVSELAELVVRRWEEQHGRDALP